MIRVHTAKTVHAFPLGTRFSTEDEYNNLCIWAHPRPPSPEAAHRPAPQRAGRSNRLTALFGAAPSSALPLDEKSFYVHLPSSRLAEHQLRPRAGSCARPPPSAQQLHGSTTHRHSSRFFSCCCENMCPGEDGAGQSACAEEREKKPSAQHSRSVSDPQPTAALYRVSAALGRFVWQLLKITAC